MAVDDTRDKILNVANNLFSRFGFHKTSMDEIAKIARKAKGSLYYHFANKEKLFTAVVINEVIILKAKLSAIIDNSDLSASEKFKQYFITRMEVLNNAANYHEILKADFFEHFDFIDELRTELDEWEESSLKKIILEGVDKGEFIKVKDIDVLLDMLIMVLKGFEIPFYLQNKYAKYAPHLDGLLAILTRGLAK